MPQQNPVVWFEIYVQDLQRAKRFYETVLGVTLEKLNTLVAGMEMWTFPMTQQGTGAGGALAKMDGVTPGGMGTLVYFSCQDCAVEAGRVAGAGGRLHKPKMSIGQYGHIALGIDPEGNMFGLHSMG
jgi:predicted enzyme related to lactoylglutathione lyase